jgi:hypothetical protein
VDFAKAFDSVSQQQLWAALEAYGIPVKIIQLIKAMYDGYECQVLHDGQLSEPFQVTTGVRQGCLLSPVLFLVAMDLIMSKVTSNRPRGIQWNLFDWLEDLDFADDICLMSHKLTDMQEKIDALAREAAKLNLKINCNKTQEMRINTNRQDPILLNGETIQQVNSFCYLGSIMTTSGGADEDVESRVKKAKAAFAQLRPIWNSRKLSLKTKLRLLNSNVMTVLFYGCETWKTTEEIRRKVQATVNRFLRSILGIRWPEVISNEDLWQRTNHVQCDVQMKKRKWNWVGHTLRRGQQHIPKQALEWNPQGSRRRGRPRQTWRRSIHQELAAVGKSWQDAKTTAGNRVRWRALSDALCFQREPQRT